jgi:predicted GNAT superfamily acetyltransferase
VVTDHIAPETPPSELDPASIEIRPLVSHEERAACVALQRSTWGEGFTDVIPASILKVSQRIGGVALGAFDQDGALVGFVFGLTGIERGRIVHWSDMLAVAPRARNLGLGRRLKEHQRTVIRQMGGDVIYWTYDPLIARNAHLNFNRLGVRLAEYVEDMYGITDSALHGGLPTDRVIVAWPTHDHEIDERRDVRLATRACRHRGLDRRSGRHRDSAVPRPCRDANGRRGAAPRRIFPGAPLARISTSRDAVGARGRI